MKKEQEWKPFGLYRRVVFWHIEQGLQRLAIKVLLCSHELVLSVGRLMNKRRDAQRDATEYSPHPTTFLELNGCVHFLTKTAKANEQVSAMSNQLSSGLPGIDLVLPVPFAMNRLQITPTTRL
jgi:hypothetical protein